MRQGAVRGLHSYSLLSLVLFVAAVATLAGW